MKTMTKTKLGCLLSFLFLLLLVVLMSLYRDELDRFKEKEKTTGMAWAPAMQLCMEKYKSLAVAGKIKVPNSRKRSENELEHIFSWSRPVGIIIKKDSGTLIISKGTCVVSKERGEITYLTLDDTIIVGDR